MNQEDDSKDTAKSLILLPFILGGGVLFLTLLIAFSEELNVSPKLMFFLAMVGFFFFNVYLEDKRENKGD